jgi:hypothetical protein
MGIAVEQIELRTYDETIILRMSNIDKLGDGSGYRCDLCIRSGDFSCQRPFYFDDSHFPDAIDALRRMNRGVAGEATIKGQWENDVVRFTSNELGHVFVTGELFEYSELTQSMRFGFRTDQTVLGPLIRDFEVLLQA